MYYNKTVICANGYEFVTKSQMPNLGNRKRGKKTKPTTEQQERHNLVKAAENLYYLLLCNFFPGDYNLAFTYPAGTVQTEEQADGIFRKFTRLYRAYCRKNCYKADYINNTETSVRGRVHHHVILHNHRDLEILEELWRKAGGGAIQYRQASKLRADYDWYNLAMYFVDRTKGGKYPDTHVKGKRRYNTSHGLKRPIVKIERVERVRWNKPKARAGYEIIPESVYSGADELTGARFLKYAMRPRK